MKIRRYVVSLFAGVAAMLLAVGAPFLAVPAFADGEPVSLKNVVMTAYPEYDDPLGFGTPNVLVMLDGQATGAETPTTIRFLIPTDAEMYSPRATDLLDRKPSDREGWDQISYELTTDAFRVEYYLPIQSTPEKSFSVQFIPLYPVNDFMAHFQEPRQSKDFSVSSQTRPRTQAVEKNAQGYNERHIAYDGAAANQTMSFGVSYVKSNPLPSTQIPIKSSTGPILVIAAVIAAIAGIAIWWMRRKPAYDRRSARRAMARSQAKGPDARLSSRPGNRTRRQPQEPEQGEILAARTSEGRETPPASGRFCTECGARVNKAARFCAECGTKQQTAPGK